MYCITEQQIEYILNDIRRNGIETEDLQLNLLDHICCMAEHNLKVYSIATREDNRGMLFPKGIYMIVTDDNKEQRFVMKNELNKCDTAVKSAPMKTSPGLVPGFFSV